MQNNHIAILVRDIHAITAKLPSFCELHDTEEHESEGTLEQYIDICPGGIPLLLMQPVAEGPYASALRKRGSGLHHLGCITTSLDDSIDHCSKAGLLLHPISLKTYSRGMVWFCRPGLPFLIELMQSKEHVDLMNCRIDLPSGILVPDYANELIENTAFRSGNASNIGIVMDDREVLIEMD